MFIRDRVTGVQGTQCLDITEKIENELGEIQWRKETPDYYKQENLQKNVTLQHDQNKN